MDLLDLTIWDTRTTKTGKERKVKGLIKDVLEHNTFRVALDDGRQKVYGYEELINKLTHEEEDGIERWDFDKVLDHRPCNRDDCYTNIEVLVHWVGDYKPSWEPMENIRKDDPVTLAKYAEENNLLDLSRWTWAKRYVKNKKKMQRMFKQAKLMKKRTGRGIKYKFGV